MVGSVAGLGARVEDTWERGPAWPSLCHNSLRRFPRYPRSQVSIRPLALLRPHSTTRAAHT